MLKVLLRRGVHLGAYETLYSGKGPADSFDDCLYIVELYFCNFQYGLFAQNGK